MENQTVPQKSYLVAYLLWLFLGWLGAHRFYTGKWITGFLYAVSFGFFGIGWAIDLFLVYFMVKSAQERLEALAEGSDVTEKEEELLAPWAEKKSILDLLQAPLYLGFFMFGPLLFILLAVMMKQTEMAIILFVILISSGFLGRMDHFLKRHPDIQRVPVLGEALETFSNLYEYYFQNKPKPFFFYLFYPFFGFLSFPFSRSVRSEFKLYAKIMGTIGAVLVIQTVWEYPEVYPPHLAIGDAALHIALRLFATFFMGIAFLMPMTTASFSLTLSGRRTMLRGLTLIALILTVPAGIFFYQDSQQSLTFLSSQLLKKRFEKPSFVNELTEASTMFLQYHQTHSAQGSMSPGEKAVMDNVLTDKYRRHVGAIAIGDEAFAFNVVRIYPPDGTFWMAVRLSIQRDHFLLYAIGPDEQVLDSWASFPEMARRCFSIGKPTHKNPSAALIYREGLLNEYIQKR